MKFEFAHEDVKVLEGKFVQLPFERFVELTDYVEDLEAKLLAAEINLREADRVGHEMEETAVPRNAPENLPEEDVQQVTRTLQRLEPAQLRRAIEKQKVSLRHLAMMTGIPYATLYRYVHTQVCPLPAAANIWLTLKKIELKNETVAASRPQREVLKQRR